VDDFKSPEAGPDFTEGQEDRILYLHGPFAHGIQRFKRWVAVALVILALGNGVALKLITYQRAEACQTRNVQIERQNEAQDHNRAFLKDVATAMHKDGAHATAMALERYIEETEKAPRLQPVKCK
jgi:uncharacterized protein HemX